jgi:hypothetical protein
MCSIKSRAGIRIKQQYGARLGGGQLMFAFSQNRKGTSVNVQRPSMLRAPSNLAAAGTISMVSCELAAA